MKTIASTATAVSRDGLTRYNPSHPLSGGGMAIQTICWVLEKSKSTGLDKLVLLLLANRYNLERGGAWPSIATLSREGGISESTVKRSLDSLEELGELLKIIRPREEASNQSNFYRFPMFDAWYNFIRDHEIDKHERVEYRGSQRTPGDSDRTPGEGFPENRNPVSSSKEEPVRETVTSLPLCKEERRALPKPIREPKVRKGFQKTLPPKREYATPPKPPEDWGWFSRTWQRYTDVFPLSRQETWDLFGERLRYFSKEQIEDRLSRWLDQRGGKITAWAAVDFLRECALMLDKEGGDIPTIVNEE